MAGELVCYGPSLLVVEGGIVRPLRIKVTERWLGLDEWEADVPQADVAALVDATVIGVQGTDLALVVHDVDETTDGTPATVSGTCVGWWLEGRLVVPPSGASHDVATGAAEDRMAAYVDRHAGPSAGPDRAWPHLRVAVSSGAGATGRSEKRYAVLSEAVSEVGREGGVGWSMRLAGGPSDRHVAWTAVPVRDRTDVATVTVDSSSRLVRTRRRRDVRTHVTVAGQGEGAARTIVEVADETVPPGRLETFRDARDVDQGADETATLTSRGQETLAGARTVETVVASLRQFGPLQVDRDVQLGDRVRLLHPPWGIDWPVIIEAVVSETTVAGTSVEVEVGGERPSLRRRLRRAGSSSGAGAGGGSSDAVDMPAGGNIDGGSASSVYLESQQFDGGGA